MKHVYLLFSGVLFSFILSGPPIISNVVPNFGDRFVLNQVEVAPSPGASGANVTWHFSRLTYRLPFLLSSIRPPSFTLLKI